MTRFNPIRYLFTGLLFITQLIDSELNAQSWNLVREQDGIQIFTRREEGRSLKSYRGVADIQAPAEKIFALLENVNDNKWWADKLIRVDVLLYEKNVRSRYYMEYGLPWPLSNRDLVVEETVSADPVKGIYTTMAVPVRGLVPEYSNKVRMPAYRQSWLITATGKGSAHVMLEGYADPAGNIPDWITNLAIVDTPAGIIKGVMKRLETGKG